MSATVLIACGFGINSDEELEEAFRLAGAVPRRVHLTDVLEKPAMLARARILALPGGFSFGDHLGSGMVLANLLRRRLRPELKTFLADGGFVIGICNGFQVLAKTGILTNLRGGWEREITLVHNNKPGYVDDWVTVRFEPQSRCVWTKGLDRLDMPIRHGEGRFVARDPAVLAELESEGLVALRYEGRNPNGSANAIAGVCDRTGRVLGLMPHPEAFLVPENHPDRRRRPPRVTGVELFRNVVRQM
ncbi:MAG TPA: phosphoribosylformylglycinamidine synthase subunit PurQ [Magnetospirillaceae bacterium]|nr:phosphoribosylformylglycinamidine synthase subunit PurQ [Magnetospirillaceae bacterium]